MKFSRIIATGLILASLITPTAFAASDNSDSAGTSEQKSITAMDAGKFRQGQRGMGNGMKQQDKGGQRGDRGDNGDRGGPGGGDRMRGPGGPDGFGGPCGPGKDGKQQDPTKMMEERKARIQADLTAGKISEEIATAEIAKIDARAIELKEFEAMTLEQKKEKATNDMKTSLDKQVLEEKLTQEKADEIQKNFLEKLATWDGKMMLRVPGMKGPGMPRQGMQGDMGKGGRGLPPQDGQLRGPRKAGEQGKQGEQKDPYVMMEERKTQIQTDLTAGKITEEVANTETAKIDQRIAEMKAFDAMTIEQKKEKVTADFKTNLEKQVTAGKLTQEKMDEKLKGFTERLSNWDGKGMPQGPRGERRPDSNK